MCGDLVKVGIYQKEYNDILDIQFDIYDIYRSKGLPAHMVNRRHFKCLKYIDFIPDILKNPDYIGMSPKETNSIELVKCYKDNVLIGIKLDSSNGYYYVSTMFDIQKAKIERRLHSGRLKAYKSEVDFLKE